MIITETVEISVRNNNKKYLLSKGYDVTKNKVKIKVNDLKDGSRYIVDVKCDICGKGKKITYCNYIKSFKNGGYYSCSGKCSNSKKRNTNLKKFGHKWASQNNNIIKKIKQTNLDKYGYECSIQNDKILEKVKKTNLKKYGHEWPSQNKIIKDKAKKTNLEKYGHEYVLQCNDIKDKIKQTNLEKYGFNNPMKNKKILKKANKTKLEKYGDPNFNNRNKAKKTNLEKYGVEYFSQSDNYVKLSKQSNLKRYGVEHYSKTNTFKKSVKETKNKKYGDSNFNNLNKIKQTNLEKYGHEFVFKSKEVRDKIKLTNLEKYGIHHTLNSNNVKKARVLALNKNNEEYSIKTYSKILPEEYKIISYDNGDFVIEHNGHEFISSLKLIYDRLKLTKSEICTLCNPLNSNSSGGEFEIVKWLKSITSTTIIENDRKILKSKELDIFLPELNIAIEYNGLYWHSELFKNKKYHLNKTKECNDKGIGLLHIWEDDWINKKEIIKSIIKNRMGIIESKIWARNCKIKEVNLSEAKSFINKNHIQGYSRCKYKIGLYYKDKLVSLMTFGSRYITSKKEFEIIRFCNKINTTVVGSASKIFKYFLKKYGVNYSKIVSYADISLFSGDLYDKLGFKKSHLSRPNYFWVVNGEKQHRFKYNKKKLVDKLNGDPNKTESEIMNEKGYYKIWSCGQIRFQFDISSRFIF